jgi:transglutaminase-like putative cysteine protease
VTSAGDPSVREDTVYALVVDSTDYPEHDFVYLLDDGIVRVEADGRASETYRQIVQILTQRGAEVWGEQTYAYNPDRERFAMNWIRVLRPDGTVISDSPRHEQETSTMVSEDYPVYTAQRIKRISLGGVAPGTLVDYSYTRETLAPPLPGDFTTGWLVTTGSPVRRSRLVLDAPAGLDLRIDEDNVAPATPRDVPGGRRVWVWAAADVPALEGEPFAGTPDTVTGYVTISGAVSWNAIAAWYTELSRDRYSMGTAADALGEIMRPAATREDSLRAAYRWITQDLRYVSLALGLGSYQPRTPDEIVATKFGDCKDKATLFLALARSMGLPAHPVLVSLDGGVDSLRPSISQFDHMIAAVETAQGRRFLDLTSEILPFDDLPPYLQGEVGLLIRPDGTGEIVAFPEDPPESNQRRAVLSGELDSLGTFRGWWTVTATGLEAFPLREMTASSAKLSAERRRQFAMGMARAIFQGADADSLEVTDGRDLTAATRVAVRFTARRATRQVGERHVFNLPIPSYTSEDLVAKLQQEKPRRFPIDAAQVNGPSVHRWSLDVTLPLGWVAELPPNVAEQGLFGSYRAEYSQEGRTLRILRQMIGRRGVEPPGSLPELVRWLEAISRDDVTFVVLNPTGGR